MQRNCPIQGCTAVHDTRQVMCRDHWLQVPRTLRARIWRNYHTHGTPLSERIAAVHEAIRLINDGGPLRTDDEVVRAAGPTRLTKE
jgi:hypothetical protein